MVNGQVLATPRQLAFIERLAADCKATIDKPLGELTVEEASEIIDDLLERVNDGNAVDRKQMANIKRRYDGWNKGARIGLAFKVCYQRWVGSGTNIFKNKDEFVENVLETYQLLNAIAERAEAA